MTQHKCRHIVLVEDDHFQSDDFTNELKSILGSSKVEVEVISCESEFLDKYEKRPSVLPDVFVIDLMLEWRQPWVDSNREQPDPNTFQDEAGLRCLDAIRVYAPDIPVIIWTMTNKEIVGGKVDNRKTFYLRKDRAMEGELFELIRRVVPAD